MTHFDATRWTFRAIKLFGISGEMIEEVAPVERDDWSVTFERETPSARLTWRVALDGGNRIIFTRSISFFGPGDVPMNHTERLGVMDPNAITPIMLSGIICTELTGQEAVPLHSRKEAKDWVRVATEDAQYVFRIGVNALVDEGTDKWFTLDDSDRWEVIHTAAEKSVGHPLGQHKAAWMNEGVRFDSYDIYQDAWYSEAGRLMQTIDTDRSRAINSEERTLA